MNDPILALTDVSRSFEHSGEVISPLRKITMSIAPGQIVALSSPSGSGKSTLLHIAGLLDRPDSGAIRICGEDLTQANDRKRTAFRRDHLGFIYQAHHLLAEFTAIENVMLPQLAAGTSRKSARAKAEELLASLGLSDRLQHRPGMLSGGQSQRVAIARALANDPALILADEPTGNLDPDTSAAVFELLLKTCRERGASALVATHDTDLAARMDSQLRLLRGAITLPEEAT